jgi:tetratricopeptide (TPR) repeat protein
MTSREIRAFRFARRCGVATLLALSPVAADAQPPAVPKTAADGVKSDPLAGFLQQGKYQEGLDWLKSFGHGSAAEERYRGLFLRGLGQADAALRVLLPIYRADPSDDEVGLAVAEASLWKKDFKTATSVTDHLKAKDAPEALRVRAMVLEQSGRLPEALALYERAIPQLPQPWGALERKAQVLSWLKRFDESAATYQKVVASKEASIELRRRCRVRLAELRAWQKDFDGALAQLAKLLDEEPRLVDALLLRGQIEEWKGEFAAAKQTYSRILAIDSTHAAARLRLDKLLWVK